MDVTQDVPVPSTAAPAFSGGASLLASAEKTQGLPRVPGLLPLRILIADDQTLAREVLRRMLRDEPEVQIVGVAASGHEAVEAIRREQPDLVLLDVEMPDLDGFGVVRQIQAPKMPAVIFVTGNESFAIRAFDIQATDYLVKPCSRERLRVALGRARELLQLRQTQDLENRLRTVLGSALPRNAAAQSQYLAVNSENRILFLKTTDIAWIECRDRQVFIHFRQQAHALADGLAALWLKLPGDQFVQVNPQTILNLAQIQELQSGPGQTRVLLRDGSQLSLDDQSLARLRQFC